MGGVILLTGATGFLGTQIARRLLEWTDHDLVALVHAPDQATARRLLLRAWWDWPELAHAVDGGAAPLAGDGRGGRVAVLAGDVRASGLGLEPAAWQALVRRITHIVHAAADLRLTAPLAEARRTNVDGVAHVLELARAAHRDHGLARLLHVSTAYVAGRRPEEVAEDDLTDRWGFANAYEHSKYEGERLVTAARAELPVTVVRPAMIVGDTRTGAIKTFNSVYAPLRWYLTRRLRVVPTRPGQRVNIVPVDWVADAIVRLTFDPAAAGQTVHLTAPPEALPRAGELLGLVRRWAADQLGVRLPRPLFIPLRPPGRGRDQLAALLPYLTERRRFRRDHADRLLGPYEPDWRVFLPRLLAYATAQGFLHRGGRTVHEQILFRLAAKSRPVTYQDIAGPTAVARDPGTVRGEMLAAAGALARLGVHSGDRVALVGVNSTRYLTVDVAVGLAGAVSVPLHPTSPPAELDEILAASAARLLLVGAPDVLARLGELRVPGAGGVLLPRPGAARGGRLGRLPRPRRRDRRRPGRRAPRPGGAGRPGHHPLHLGHHRAAQGGRLHPPAARLDGPDHGRAAALDRQDTASHLPVVPAHEPRRRGHPWRLRPLLAAGAGADRVPGRPPPGPARRCAGCGRPSSSRCPGCTRRPGRPWPPVAWGAAGSVARVARSAGSNGPCCAGPCCAAPASTVAPSWSWARPRSAPSCSSACASWGSRSTTPTGSARRPWSP